MRLLLLFAVLICSVLTAAAQSPQPTPPPSSTPTPSQTPLTPDPQRSMQSVRSLGTSDMNRMQSAFSLNPVGDLDRLSSRIVYLQQWVAPLYRKPTSEELQLVAPSPVVAQTYSSVLREKDTGIFKLMPDAGCAVNDRVISAKEECIKFSMPGAANSYSFRTQNYRIKRLADLTYNGAKFEITGTFMHGILADIGDIPIEQISLATPGVKFAADFRPSTTFDDVIPIDRSLISGVEVRGFKYGKAAPAIPNNSYVLRCVAYRGRLVRAMKGIAYNELDYDKRKDVTIAFRIVAKDSDGSITIVWKQLAEADSPKLKVPKKDDVQGDDEAGN